MSLLATYRSLLVAQLQQAAQYRVQALLWMLFAIIRPIIFLAAWAAVATTQGGSVGGFSVGDFTTYFVCLTLVTHLTMAWNSHEFEFEIRQGRLSPKLLRPLHPLHYSVVENSVFKLTTIVPLSLVLLGVVLTFGARFETQPFHLILFVPSVVLAAALAFVTTWVIATLAFWVTRMRTANTLFMRASFIFAGQIAPIALVPGWLQALSYALPFWYMLGAPTEILRGSTTLEASLLIIAVQALWLCVAWVAFTFAWRAGLRQYSAVGA
ncbi:MAG: ABC-2 family transporter protein [Actinobacteria bacterium]|nr:ABC-2 family transporter protein [Actinomycetota bacterium]